MTVITYIYHDIGTIYGYIRRYNTLKHFEGDRLKTKHGHIAMKTNQHAG